MTQTDHPTKRRCPTCRRADRVRVRLPHYSCEYHHDGRIHTITVTDLDVWRCTDPRCAEIVLDREALRTLDRACRDQLGLLQPEVIREQREKLRLSAREVAGALRMYDETYARLEGGGQIQSREIDLLLRLFFKLPEVRQELGGPLAALPNGTAGQAITPLPVGDRQTDV